MQHRRIWHGDKKKRLYFFFSVWVLTIRGDKPFHCWKHLQFWKHPPFLIHFFLRLSSKICISFSCRKLSHKNGYDFTRSQLQFIGAIRCSLTIRHHGKSRKVAQFIYPSEIRDILLFVRYL